MEIRSVLYVSKSVTNSCPSKCFIFLCFMSLQFSGVVVQMENVNTQIKQRGERRSELSCGEILFWTSPQQHGSLITFIVILITVAVIIILFRIIITEFPRRWPLRRGDPVMQPFSGAHRRTVTQPLFLLRLVLVVMATQTSQGARCDPKWREAINEITKVITDIPKTVSTYRNPLWNRCS